MPLFLYERNLNLKEDHGMLQFCLPAWSVKGKDKGGTILASNLETFLVCIFLKWITFHFFLNGLKIIYLGNVLMLISLWAWIVTISFLSSFFFSCLFLFLIVHFCWNTFIIQSGQRVDRETNRRVRAKRGKEHSRKPAMPPDLISSFIPAVYYQWPPGARIL